MSKKHLKKFPVFNTDEEAEEFVATADLSEYDFSGFKPVRFEFTEKIAPIALELPQDLLDAVKAKAEARGIPYTSLIREMLEQAVSS